MVVNTELEVHTMRHILIRGLIGAATCAIGFSVFLIIMSGGPIQFITYQSQRNFSGWSFILPLLVGGFGSGAVNAALKVPVRFLLVGILLIPIAALIVYAMNLTPTKSAAQLLMYLVFPLAAAFALTLPTLLVWIVGKILRLLGDPKPMP